MTTSQGLIFLKEHEFGFHPTTLGFPSIDACRAIVLQTGQGLFGWHQAGGAYGDRLATYGNKFADYIRGHRHGTAASLHIYTVTHIGVRGGYGGVAGTPAGNAQQGREHLAEIAAYSQAIGHAGPIHSFDLSARWPANSCYVEFQLNAGVCQIRANTWHGTGNLTANYDAVRGNDHRNGQRVLKAPKLMFTQVNTTGSTQVVPLNI